MVNTYIQQIRAHKHRRIWHLLMSIACITQMHVQTHAMQVLTRSFLVVAAAVILQ